MNLVGVQLTFDGREVPITGTGARGRPLTLTQKRVLRYLDRHQFIRPREAGLLLYEVMASPGSRDQYASSDGWGVLNRLQKRGLVDKRERGVYVSRLS